MFTHNNVFLPPSDQIGPPENNNNSVDHGPTNELMNPPTAVALQVQQLQLTRKLPQHSNELDDEGSFLGVTEEQSDGSDEEFAPEV